MSDTIQIDVATQFIGKQQKAEQEVFVFSYTVSITNQSNAPITLRSRYWLITNGNGEKAEVSGEGVVGEQPTIEPQQTYQYTSASVLKTEVGSMQGHYNFELEDNGVYRAAIPIFRLAVPNALH